MIISVKLILTFCF